MMRSETPSTQSVAARVRLLRRKRRAETIRTWLVGLAWATGLVGSGLVVLASLNGGL